MDKINIPDDASAYYYNEATKWTWIGPWKSMPAGCQNELMLGSYTMFEGLRGEKHHEMVRQENGQTINVQWTVTP